MSNSLSDLPTATGFTETGLIDIERISGPLRPILLVEDNPNDLELTLTALARCQLSNEIIVARDGVEALDYLHRRNQWADREPGLPAVVLLDLKLPRINGMEVLEQVKNDLMLQHVPIVMLTSSSLESDLATSYQKGVNAFVVKPINLNEFFRAIQDLGMFWGAVNKLP
ncbi:MAG: response regulator [Cytophagaceae bacterium]|nr:MAG: response regulator [Cytophagaceae bacterium]